MSSGAARRVSRQDIQLVQNLIERCLQLYMNQKEVVETLLDQAKIEPDFTELVWQKLVEENQDFFEAYHLRLMVKHQINVFNELLKQQVDLMHRICPARVDTVPIPNGSQLSALQQNSACYPSEHVGPSMKPSSMHRHISSGLSNAFTNGGSSLQTSMHTAVDMSANTCRIDAPQDMLSTRSPNLGLMQGMNGGMIKPEAGYSGSSPFMFGADNTALEKRVAIGDASVTPFSSVVSNSQTLGEPLLDSDTSSYGFLGQIPQSFSLSDLTAGFSQSSDILESYPRSPFLTTDTDNFMDSRGRGENQGDSKRLDTISEGLSYEDFPSD